MAGGVVERVGRWKGREKGKGKRGNGKFATIFLSFHLGKGMDMINQFSSGDRKIIALREKCLTPA